MKQFDLPLCVKCAGNKLAFTYVGIWLVQVAILYHSPTSLLFQIEEMREFEEEGVLTVAQL